MTNIMVLSWPHFLALLIPLALAAEPMAYFRQRRARANLMSLPLGLASVLVGAFDLALAISIVALEKAVAGLVAVLCGMAPGLYLSHWPRLRGKPGSPRPARK